MKPVNGRVVLASPTLWYSTVNINRGSSDGVHVNDPVITGDGLVGRVTKIVGDAAQVTLLTDPDSGVTARIGRDRRLRHRPDRHAGQSQRPAAAAASRAASARRGSASRSSPPASSRRRFTSYFPPDIPIGVVTEVDPNELDTSQQVHIRPYADLHDLDIVQVLTQPSTRSTGPS